MSNADFLGRAIETVKKAIETDTAGEYEKAYQLYYSAREWHTAPAPSLPTAQS
jgi:vacuolar protein-sorting-associated protein 4